MSTDLTGKRALVTGAAGGIGQAIVSILTERGAHVCVSDRESDALSATFPVSTVKKIAGDLRDPEFSSTLAQAANEQLGGLDIVINNAGIIHRGTVLDTTDEQWAMTMQVNVDAVFRICRDAVGILQKNGGGAIVNLSSCWGLYPGPDHAAYCTSKAAVAALTRCLARDHAADNIRVNAVAPNEVNTSMLRSGFEIRGLDSESAIETLNQTVPLGRIAEPEDIAKTVAYLVSDDASYVCGACIEINGAKPVY